VLSLSVPARGGLGFGSWLLNPFFISSVMLKAGWWSCVIGLKRCGASCAVVGGGSESRNRGCEHDLIRESPRPSRFPTLLQVLEHKRDRCWKILLSQSQPRPDTAPANRISLVGLTAGT
jgi:hypothetical protein